MNPAALIVQLQAVGLTLNLVAGCASAPKATPAAPTATAPTLDLAKERAHDPYARHAAAMNAPPEGLIDVNQHGGGFYVVQVPPNERVTLDVPAMCLDYSRAVPTARSLGGGLAEPGPLLAQMVAVHDHMIATVGVWETRLEGTFDLPALHRQLASRTLDMDMRALEQVNADVERLLRDMRGGDLSAFAANARRGSEIAERALRAMESPKKPAGSSPATRPLTPAERRQTVVTLLGRALQWAAWRDDPAFVRRLEDGAKKPEQQPEINKVLGRLSYIIREAALARISANDDGIVRNTP